MPVAVLSRKIRSAHYRFSRAIAGLRERAVARRKRRDFEAWLAHLHAQPPEVLLGSNFAEFGGVRGHIHAIQKHSGHNVELAPTDELLRKLEPHDLSSTFNDAFLDFEPRGIGVAHSHVFPWFIEWCSRHHRRVRWVHTYHAPYFPEYARENLLPWQIRFNDILINVARHAHVRISVSRWQQEWLSENHGIQTNYLPNGVDVALCDDAEAQRFVARTGRDDFVLYVGRNDPVKNPVDFVRLAQRMPGQQFVMIGRDLGAEALRTEWKVTAPPNLLICGDATHAQVQDALAACRALVVTSRREGLPTVVLEAMAHAKPVVVPNEAGCVEAIANGAFGYIFTPGDVTDLASQTRAALDDARGPSARAHVLAEYDWRVIAPRLDAIYDSA